MLFVTAGLLLLSAGALAQSGGTPPQPVAEQPARIIAAVQRALGIKDDGVAGPRTKRAVRRFQRKHGLTVDGIIGSAVLEALAIDPGGSQARGAVATDPALARIAACESGGDPQAVSAGGRYRGKYQFDRATWREIGGKGDPAKAPEAEQDARAAELYARRGTEPWPNCARA